jgi:hypothetical protein
MKSAKVFFGIALGALLLIATYGVYVRASRYVILSQKSYVTAQLAKTMMRGFAVRSPGELRETLKEYGVAQADFDSEQSSVNFNEGFVFIVENGSLLEISHGFSGFDLAVLSPSTNLSIAIVRGPTSRPLKAVAR